MAVTGRNAPAAACRGRFLVAFGPVRAGQVNGGPWAKARMRRRAWHSSEYEGWPQLRLIISVRAWRTTRPGRDMTPKRTAFIRLLTHAPPRANRFIAEFRLKDSAVMAHQAALDPNCPEGSRPPARSSFSALWTSSPFPHRCLDHQTNSSGSMSRLVTTPKTLNQPPSAVSMTGTERFN